MNKEQLKTFLPEMMEIMVERGIVTNRGNGFYDCPFCGSGTNNNGTPAFHIAYGTRFHCFSCGAHGDIFDLVSHMENISATQWKRLYAKTLSLVQPYIDEKQFIDVSTPAAPEKSEPDDYRDFLLECHQNVGKTDYFRRRGLSEETIDRFMLGFHPHKNLVTIPYNADLSSGYIHRILWSGNNKYCKHGNEIFNAAALQNHDTVFVTEGQFDALSFEELGYPCVGLGGTNEIGKLVALLNATENRKTLILALDNDAPGRKATAKLIDMLAETDCDLMWNTRIYREFKDANEFLVRDREGFRQMIEEVTLPHYKE